MNSYSSVDGAAVRRDRGDPHRPPARRARLRRRGGGRLLRGRPAPHAPPDRGDQGGRGGPGAPGRPRRGAAGDRLLRRAAGRGRGRAALDGRGRRGGAAGAPAQVPPRPVRAARTSTPSGPAAVFDTPTQRALARRAASEAVVVLTNDGVLPLAARCLDRGDRSRRRRPAPAPGRLPLPGPHRDQPAAAGRPVAEADRAGRRGGRRASCPRPAARSRSGCTTRPTSRRSPPSGPPTARTRCSTRRAARSRATTRRGLPQAAVIAAEADVAVVVVAGRSGLVPSSTVGEARDAMDLGLTGVQAALVDVVVATGTPTVVVVLSGRVHALEAIAGSAAALVQAFPLGEEGGAGAGRRAHRARSHRRVGSRSRCPAAPGRCPSTPATAPAGGPRCSTATTPTARPSRSSRSGTASATRPSATPASTCRRRTRRHRSRSP